MPVNRLPKRNFRRTTHQASSSVSETSLSETTDQLIAFWQRRFGGGGGRISCPECEVRPGWSRNAYDDCSPSCSGSASVCRGGDFQSLLRPHPEDIHHVEYAACSSSTLIFTLMALVSAFLVVSVTVILVRVKPILQSGVQAAGAAAPVALPPRDFTLGPPKPAPKPFTVRLARMDEASRWNFRWTFAKHTPHKPSPRMSVTGTETREKFRWAPAGETPAAILTRESLAVSRTTGETAASSLGYPSQGGQSSPSPKVDDTYADEVSTSSLGALAQYRVNGRE
ncbi:hypothetical protein HPB52_012013 [Rhipicephalus sanguineus]|uniref:Uncharacterized protein n=1 Tax=Rhipicephalus sanguineus TaxID=34632 RepID=A0A9D4PMY0_RHISA|nr:hypothetical protein HPB52_012013 [Rhipicephalus sanguineus]